MENVAQQDISASDLFLGYPAPRNAPPHVPWRRSLQSLQVEQGRAGLLSSLYSFEQSADDIISVALWLVGSTKTMSGMFSGKLSKGKINFQKPNSVVFFGDRRKLILHANQSIITWHLSI